MHSVSDLTTSSRKTSGTVPPKLVGASTTIVGDKLYLFGGRLVAERRMVADLYVFDLDTFVWTCVPPYPGDDVPGARYFHSADSWRNYLIIFGGMGHKPEATTTDDLVVLNDVRFLDLNTFRWLPPDARNSFPDTDPIDPSTSQQAEGSRSTSSLAPRARYAHLSAISGGRLHIIGGQDLQNAWLDDICVYDLRLRKWAARRSYPRHAGTYRSVAVAAEWRVRDPQKEVAENRATGLGPLGMRFGSNVGQTTKEFTSSESLVHLPYSTEATDDFPNDIYLYSNYNFTDVKRELEVFTPRAGSASDLDMTDRSSAMSGTVLPPGLRFPTGAICGHHLIFTGTYLAHSYQSYSIWALDLTNMTWARLDPGAALATGSWFRAALWVSQKRSTSKLLIFGNRQGSLVEDYNRRLLAWDDVAVVDLEAFGIYQPPPRALDIRSQELGLAALEEALLADFEIVTDDGRRIPCSRRLLESRWPWFREQRRLIREATNRLISGNAELTSAANTAPPLPPTNGEGEDALLPAPVPLTVGATPDIRPDPRMTPRALVLSEPYAVALALLQYLYSRALLTPLQHAPAVLSQLLLLSASYGLDELGKLVRHAMHRALAPTTSVGVYEVATLCGCQSLQIRALKAVMASSRRNNNRARGGSTSNTGSGGGPNGGSGSGGGGSGPRDGGPSQGPGQGQAGGGPGASSGLAVSMSRSRGMSDTRGLGFGSYGNSAARPGSMLGSGIPEDISPDAEMDGDADAEVKVNGWGVDYNFDVGVEDSDEEVGTLGRDDSSTPTASVPLSPLPPASFDHPFDHTPPAAFEPAPPPSLTYSLSDTDKRKIEQRMSQLRRSNNLSVDSLYRALQEVDAENEETPASALTFGRVSPLSPSANTSTNTSASDVTHNVTRDTEARAITPGNRSVTTSISPGSEFGELRPRPARSRPLPVPPQGSVTAILPGNDFGRLVPVHFLARSASAPILDNVRNQTMSMAMVMDARNAIRESGYFIDRPPSFAIPFEVADNPLAEPESNMPSTPPSESVVASPVTSPKIPQDSVRFSNKALYDLVEEDEEKTSVRTSKRRSLSVSVALANSRLSTQESPMSTPSINREPEIEIQSLNPSIAPRRRAYTDLADLALTIPDFKGHDGAPKTPASARTASSSGPISPCESLLVTTASMYEQPSPLSSPTDEILPPLPTMSATMSKFPEHINARSGMYLDPNYRVEHEREEDMGGLSESSTSSSYRSQTSMRPSPITPDSPTLSTPAMSEIGAMESFASVHGLVLSLGQAQREREKEKLRHADVHTIQRSYAAEARVKVRERTGMNPVTESDKETSDDVDMDMFEEALLARRRNADVHLGFGELGAGLEGGKVKKDRRISLSAAPHPPLSPSTHPFSSQHEYSNPGSPRRVAFVGSPKDDQMMHEARYNRSETRQAKAESRQGLAAAGFVINDAKPMSPRMLSPVQTGLSPTRSKFAHAPPSPLSLSHSISTDTSSSAPMHSPPKRNLSMSIQQTKTYARQDTGLPSPLPFSNFAITRELDPRDKTPTPVTTTITVEKGTGSSLFSKLRKKSNNDARPSTPTVGNTASPLSITFSNNSTNSGSGSGSNPNSSSRFSLTPTPTPQAPVGGYPGARSLSPKSAKAEAKRRKKEEEKARLEALALQFSQNRKKINIAAGGNDSVSIVGSGSVFSGSSGEKRRIANEWVEESKCMYGAGGIVSSWGGL